MESVEILKSIIEKCDICYNGDIISKEMLLRTLYDFLTLTASKDKHNVGVVLHTGSECFEAVMLSFAAISNLIFNESNPIELVESLETGEIVLYGGNSQGSKPERYLFSEISIEEIPHSNGKKQRYAVLEQQGENKYSKTKVPENRWGGITRYLGTSTNLGGIGIKKESGKRAEFLKNVAGFSDDMITRTVDASTVIVMSKAKADSLINGISFVYGDNEIKLTDLVTASYYTSGDSVYAFGINTAKSEPVIKVTGNVSTARKILLRTEWNRNIGLFVFGSDIIRKEETALPELINRRSIQYVYMCSNIDSDYAFDLVQNTEDVNLFACTKDYLRSNTSPVVVDNPSTNAISRQVDAIINRQIVQVKVDGIISWEVFKKFKRAMYSIKASEYDNEEKDEFIISAYSLFNLFQTAVFPLGELDDAIKNNVVNTSGTVNERITGIIKHANALPTYLKENCDIVVESLNGLNDALYFANPKLEAIKEILDNNDYESIALVVPKAYYIPIIKKILGDSRIIPMTANQFDNSKLYDAIIVLGNIDGTRFDPFRCRASANIFVLLYEGETKLFGRKGMKSREIDRMYNSKSFFTIDTDELFVENESVDPETDEIEKINESLENYQLELTLSVARAYSREYDNRSGFAETVAVATFDNSEVAFFSKNYMAYVLDENEQTVKEVKATDLAEGDSIIFTRSSEKAKDIVDELLNEMISEKRLSDLVCETYYKSKAWKEKLIAYMRRYDLTATQVANIMIRNGISVQPATIRNWLYDESHIVGPRDVESIRHIALLIGDKEMQENAEEYFAACREIRSIRIKIMKAIARAVLGSIVGEDRYEDNIYFSAVSENIDELATILRIESISFEEGNVQNNMINRPISLQ